MAWPQQPPAQPNQPGSPPPAASTLSIPALIAGISGVLTFLFSFVQIVKIDNDFVDFGASVWTTDFGLFGIGTWIPLFALVAGGAAMARTLAAGLDEREVAGFTLRQVQLVALLFAILVWLGYLVNAVLAEALAPALGMFLLFIGLAGVTAGTAMDVLGVGGPASAAGAARGPARAGAVGVAARHRGPGPPVRPVAGADAAGAPGPGPVAAAAGGRGGPRPHAVAAADRRPPRPGGSRPGQWQPPPAPTPGPGHQVPPGTGHRAVDR